MPRNNNPAEQHGGIADHLHDAAVGLTDNLRDVAVGARDAAADKYKRSRDAAMRWEHNLESRIADKPLQSLLIAAGIGFLAGMLWKRR
jgi:ElaB/YqjD/DUF883 family membrane-anchored ribosome-binding protein